MKLPGCVAKVAEGFDGPIGFACGAPFANNSYRIGPLYADTFDIAMSLIKTLLDEKKEQNEKFENIFIQVPSNHGKMIEFMKFLEFEIDRKLIRTYTKRDEIMVPMPQMTYALGAL